MDFEKIKELIQLVDSSDLAFFEIQTDSDHIKMDKSLNRNMVETNTNNLPKNIENTMNTTNIVNSKQELKQAETHIDEIVEDDHKVITSPMVGTFYLSASPESEAFVKVGDQISKGKVICIIEAMKLMNEIESEYNGIISKCFVNDGDMVEYGQPLFKIKGE